ncbi:MAG: tetratricopeptide repeat protein [Sedimentisphaerales bacterium]|nr:tetratricopeptide repeat protein [Sedimentisphaerales bacterium]
MEMLDEKIETTLADPWLSKMSNRLPFSIFFVMAALLAIKPLIINRLISRAEAYASRGFYNNAERECKKVLFLDGDNEIALNTLASAYNSRGDLDNAINTYLNAININSSNKVAHFWGAMVFAKQGSFNRAIPHFEYIKSLGKETTDQLNADSFSYYRASLEMLVLCYKRTGNIEKQQHILDVLKNTYPGYNGTIDNLDIIERYSDVPYWY